MKKVTVTKQLTNEEKEELKSCETTIQACITKPFDMGRALRTILEGELFLATHSSFVDYVESRWKLNRSGAYGKVNAANVADFIAKSDLPDLTNEAQAMALHKIKDDAKKKVVWEKANSSKKRHPTAKRITEINDQLYGEVKQPWYVRRLKALKKEVKNFKKKLEEDMPTISQAEVNLFGTIADDMEALKKELASLANRVDEAGQESED